MQQHTCMRWDCPASRSSGRLLGQRVFSGSRNLLACLMPPIEAATLQQHTCVIDLQLERQHSVSKTGFRIQVWLTGDGWQPPAPHTAGTEPQASKELPPECMPGGPAVCIPAGCMGWGPRDSDTEQHVHEGRLERASCTCFRRLDWLGCTRLQQRAACTVVGRVRTLTCCTCSSRARWWASDL